MKFNDVAMMKNPDAWPCWPVLPVKLYSKPDNFPKCGFLFADGKPAIYMTNLYALDDRPGTTYKEKLEGVERVEFSSFEEMVATGWEVD